MRLVGIVLVTAYFDTGILAAEVVKAFIETDATIQGVAVEGAVAIDALVARADVTHQVGRRLVHCIGEEAPNIAIGLMLDANGIAVGRARMPCLVGLAHHLRHLAVGGTDDIVRRHLGITVLEPADAACIRALCVMDDHCTYIHSTFTIIAVGGRVPNGSGIVGFTLNAQSRRCQHIVMLSKNRFQVNVIFREAVLFSMLLIIHERANRIEHGLHRINVLLLPFGQLRKLLDSRKIIRYFSSFDFFGQTFECLSVGQHICIGTPKDFFFRNA